MMCRRILLIGLLAAVFGGCSTPVVKPDAFSLDVLERRPLPGEHVFAAGEGELRVEPGSAWMQDIRSHDGLSFVGLDPENTRFAAVVICDPSIDRLVVVPLADAETPLDVVSDAARRAEVRRRVDEARGEGGERNAAGRVETLSLRRVLDEGRLASPLPPPRRIFAVAANFPSHLVHDLAMEPRAGHLDALRNSRARVFLKYPPLAAPESPRPTPRTPAGVVGPFAGISYPAQIALPAEDEDEEPTLTATRVDYEVELGVVIGRRLTPADVAKATTGDLLAAVAGYVLIGDTKARNPQVLDRILGADQPLASEAAPYRTGVDDLDATLGAWDRETCAWWSHAASWGNYASVGPVFHSPDEAGFMPRALLTARSYAEAERRGFPLPDGRDAGVLYVRQCSIATREASHPDRMIWGVPEIIRSILAPDSIVPFPDGERTLEPGDMISLGTPGGTIIQSKPSGLVSFLRSALFWWSPLDFHDMFFGRDEELYLHDGDSVFYWAEGLGYQLQPIRRLVPGPRR